MTEKKLIDLLSHAGADARGSDTRGDDLQPPRGWERKVWARIRLRQGLDSETPATSASPVALAFAMAILFVVGFSIHRSQDRDASVREAAATSLLKIEDDIKQVQAEIAVYHQEMKQAFQELELAQSEEERFRALARKKQAEIEQATAYARLTGLRNKARGTSMRISDAEQDDAP